MEEKSPRIGKDTFHNVEPLNLWGRLVRPNSLNTPKPGPDYEAMSRVLLFLLGHPKK